ncbi:MAG: ribonuclease Z [Promethearchaeota archaeon]
MEVIILGSGGAIPVKERNLPAIALRLESSPELFIFDCGEDIQRRFIEAGLKLNKPLTIFITHFHGDHINGLPGLLFRFSLIERSAPLMIFGPKNIFYYLYFHRKIVGLKASYPITIVEIDDENDKLIFFDNLDSEQPIKEEKIENNIILEKRKYLIKYTPVVHSILTYGYSFIEKPRNGKFNPEIATKMGIPRGYLWKNLQEGLEIEFKGNKINPEKEGIVGPKRPGRKVTYSGDTIPCDSLIQLGLDSDLLIHEATYSNKLTSIAIEKKHSTSVDAANDAIKMRAKQLILTHVSSRYQYDASELLLEAKEIFPNTILAEDLLKITLK